MNTMIGADASPAQTGPSTVTINLTAVNLTPVEQEVVVNKQLRRDIDKLIQVVKSCPSSRERSICVTKLQEAVMWLGMDLKRLNEPNPYPNSKDPSNTKVEPTADGLKL